MRRDIQAESIIILLLWIFFKQKTETDFRFFLRSLLHIFEKYLRQYLLIHFVYIINYKNVLRKNNIQGFNLLLLLFV